MRCPLSLCAVLALVVLACGLAPAAVDADHCYKTCCSIGWSYYGYNNITKRAAANIGVSSCNCASDEAFSCTSKPSGGAASAYQSVPRPSHPARGTQTPNDSCFGACCPGEQPDMKDKSPTPQFTVTTYGYSDFEIVQSTQGPCVCYADVMFGCASKVQLD